MDIQPIKTEQDYDLALSTIEELWDAKEGTDEGDRLDILITLVDAYEQVNHPIYPPDPVSAIEFHMDQNELTRIDLEEYIGTRARVSEVLNGKRGLSIEMIRNLHEGLGIPLESLIARPKESRAS
ncbi:helix-turn-helix domain-containing protein [Granulosicoccus sp.]|nr:helix-turn-helix domain-containing protein [Granulosicoccus sp.]MDB4223219.1 helix-turn-helix domain-containing protein [Granulosicoccus sp.]